MFLKSEAKLELRNDGFNVPLATVMSFNLTGLAMHCFDLMKAWVVNQASRSSSRLIDGLLSNGETCSSFGYCVTGSSKYFDEDFVHRRKEQREEKEKKKIDRKKEL